MTDTRVPWPKLSDTPEVVQFLPSDLQRVLYIEGAREIITGAIEEGWFSPLNEPLPMVLDDVGDAAEFAKLDTKKREEIHAKLGVLAALEDTRAVTRMHSNFGIEVEFDERDTPKIYATNTGTVFSFEDELTEPEKSPDELHAEIIIERMRERQFHAECHKLLDYELDKVRFYALVMPASRYDELVAASNEETRQYFAKYGQEHLFQPRDTLPWEVVVMQKGFATGFESREQALRAAAEPYMAKTSQ